MWQEWYGQFGDYIDLAAIAVDNQPGAAILPWVDRARATYTVLHDRDNSLYQRFRHPVTSTLLLDEKGRLVRPWKYADPLDSAFRRELSQWAKTGAIPGPWLEEDIANAAAVTQAGQNEVYQLLREATALADRGEHGAASAHLEQALTLDPGNYVLQKQLGVLQRPDDYYKGDMPAINFVWPD